VISTVWRSRYVLAGASFAPGSGAACGAAVAVAASAETAIVTAAAPAESLLRVVMAATLTKLAARCKDNLTTEIGDSLPWRADLRDAR
jgi:hypothetical protein